MKITDILDTTRGIRHLDIKHPIKIGNTIALPRGHKLAKEADYAVCMRVGVPTIFTDNLYSKCSKCKYKIYFRPDNPKGPKLICLECAVLLLEEDNP